MGAGVDAREIKNEEKKDDIETRAAKEALDTRNDAKLTYHARVRFFRGRCLNTKGRGRIPFSNTGIIINLGPVRVRNPPEKCWSGAGSGLSESSTNKNARTGPFKKTPKL